MASVDEMRQRIASILQRVVDWLDPASAKQRETTEQYVESMFQAQKSVVEAITDMHYKDITNAVLGTGKSYNRTFGIGKDGQYFVTQKWNSFEGRNLVDEPSTCYAPMDGVSSVQTIERDACQ